MLSHCRYLRCPKGCPLKEATELLSTCGGREFYFMLIIIKDELNAVQLEMLFPLPSAKVAGSDMPEEKGLWCDCWKYQRSVGEYNCWSHLWPPVVWIGNLKRGSWGIIKWGACANDWLTCAVGPLLQRHVQVHFRFCTTATAADLSFLWSKGKPVTPPPRSRR